ncbi:MAG: histidine kinase [Muribaculaceae bacterium]|nr:histidine kinase [Muribaculaceae bacterium]
MNPFIYTTRREWLTYAAVWLFLFGAPLVSLYVHASLDEHITFRWVDVLHIWGGLLVMLALFIIHNLWIAPLLTHHHRLRTYCIAVLAMMLLFMAFVYTRRPPMSQGPKPPGFEMTPPNTPQQSTRPPKPPHWGTIPPIEIDKMMSVMMLLLIFGANVGIKHMSKSMEENRRKQHLEREGLKQELAYLKYQMNPHFFMNTLNNIHALVDIDPEKAKTCILELSRMMRYMLYECNKDTVKISRGTEMIENYIALMRIRYDERVDIQFSKPDTIPDMEVPPLLIIPFVENAFKHGVSYADKSYIHVKLNITDTHCILICDNSKHADDTEHGGVGLKNVIKRLDLIYGNNYTVKIDDKPDHYQVTLKVPKTIPA